MLDLYTTSDSYITTNDIAHTTPKTLRHQWCSGKYSFGETHGERGARAYNGGLRAEPPAGSSGRAPGVGSGGAPLKLKRFYVLDMQWKQQTCLTNYNSLYFGN